MKRKAEQRINPLLINPLAGDIWRVGLRAARTRWRAGSVDNNRGFQLMVFVST